MSLAAATMVQRSEGLGNGSSMANEARVWLVDDDPALRELVRFMVGARGYLVETFASGEEVLAHVGDLPDAVLLDLMMPGVDGVQVLRELKRRDPDLPVIILTAVNDVRQAVEVTKLGAYDYLLKPIAEERLESTLRHAVSQRSLERKVAQLKCELGERYHLRHIVGSSAAMRRVYEQIEKVLESDITVFISGESGSGKELVAKAIHYGSPRAAGPFVDVNCAAIPEGLQESELFGHERGAFTGAVAAHPGKFEQANGGTILLDEVGEMSPSAQARLLRVLQERSLQRVGGTRRIELDVRVISASNRDLAQLTRDGVFRQDLFYRLVVFPVHIPPLRERRDDVPLLVEHFLTKYARDAGRKVTRVHPAAMARLVSYGWPGNVRELENVIHRALLVMGESELGPGDLPPELASSTGPQPLPPAGDVASLEELEKRAIREALACCGGNLSDAARRLGIGRSTLYRKLDQYGLREEGGEAAE
jgi:two-component system response regulator HydG